MEDLSQKLTEVLQDPSRMQQIMEMASAMGFGNISEESKSEQPITQETFQQVSHVIHQAEAKDKRQETLIKALLPYLSRNRKLKLERAMQISHLSRLAGVALKNNIIPWGQADEEDCHV